MITGIADWEKNEPDFESRFINKINEIAKSLNDIEERLTQLTGNLEEGK